MHPVLVATGPEPLDVDAALDDLDAPAGRLLLLDGPCESWAEEAARMTLRLDALLAEEPPAGVVVRGGTESALAATRSALRLGVPVLHLPVDEHESADHAATQAAIAELVGLADVAGRWGALPRRDRPAGAPSPRAAAGPPPPRGRPDGGPDAVRAWAAVLHDRLNARPFGLAFTPSGVPSGAGVSPRGKETCERFPGTANVMPPSGDVQGEGSDRRIGPMTGSDPRRGVGG